MRPVVTTARPRPRSPPRSGRRDTPADRRDQDRQLRNIEERNDSIEPDATDANSSAEATPAPMPMRTICTIFSCPALSG